jgi:hypothetical protein
MEGIKYTEVAKDLIQLAKKWVFQGEQGAGGFKHWQIQVSLIKKIRQQGLVDLISKTCIKGAHVSPMSNNGKGTFSYVMKADSRMEDCGPYTDETWKEPEVMPVELEGIKLFIWQMTVYEKIIAHDPRVDDRSVNVIIDTAGGQGKTVLKRLLAFWKIAVVIPPMKCAEDFSAVVMAQPISKGYVVDIPRSMKTPKEYGALFTALEELKNGSCWDKRYKFQSKSFSSPAVWVFCNNAPPPEALSRDRWNWWLIGWDKALIRYTDQRMANITAYHKAEREKKELKEKKQDMLDDIHECDFPFGTLDVQPEEEKKKGKKAVAKGVNAATGIPVGADWEREEAVWYGEEEASWDEVDQKHSD